MRVLPLVLLAALPGCGLFGPSLDLGRFEGDGRVFTSQVLLAETREVAFAGAAQFRLVTDSDGNVWEAGISLRDENGEGTVFFGLGLPESGPDATGDRPYYDGVGTYAIGDEPGEFGASHFPAGCGLCLDGLTGTLRLTTFEDDEVAGTFEGGLADDPAGADGWQIEFRARVTRETR